jgi:hypothetical protein
MTDDEAKALWALALDFAKLKEHAAARKREDLNHDCNAGIELAYNDAFTRLSALLPPMPPQDNGA